VFGRDESVNDSLPNTTNSYDLTTAARQRSLGAGVTRTTRQRFQQLFFPDGISFDGSGFVRTAVTAPAFNYLRPIEGGNEGASWPG
jgi:hypothetical protein